MITGKSSRMNVNGNGGRQAFGVLQSNQIATRSQRSQNGGVKKVSAMTARSRNLRQQDTQSKANNNNNNNNASKRNVGSKKITSRYPKRFVERNENAAKQTTTTTTTT